MSLLALSYGGSVEVIVVDNASTDGSAELIRHRFPGIDLVEMPDNKGFAGAASVGLFMASGDIVAAVNPDVRLDPDWLSVMARTLSVEQEIGIVGSKILYPDGKTIQHAGGVVHYPLATTDHIGRGEIDTGQYDTPAEASFVTGAALAMWAEVGRSLQYFDPDYYPLYYEDVDLCWRARKEGLRVLYQPRAVALHKESVSMDRRSTLYYSYYHANRLRFVVKRYTPEEVMFDFLPAEAARVVGDMPAEDRRASFDLLENRQPGVPMANGVVNGVANSAASVAGFHPGQDRLQGHLKEVMGGWRVREKPFSSSAPVVGKGIVWLRNRLNNLSTRWYVQPIVQQQVDYNASVARTLREVSSRLAEIEARMRLQAMLTAGLVTQRRHASVEDLTAEVDTLRARIDLLEKELARSYDRGGVT
jgi:GT2 family glycosyltransferase